MSHLDRLHKYQRRTPFPDQTTHPPSTSSFAALSTTSCRSTSSQLPAEVIFMIAEPLDIKAINALQRTSNSLHHMLLSYLYKRDAQAGTSALLWAAQSDMLPTAKLSLQMGGDALARLDKPGMNTLQSSPWDFYDRYQSEDKPAFLNFGCRTTGLGIAAHRGSVRLAQILLEHVDKLSDIESESRAEYYQRLLVIAAMEGHTEVAEMLLKRGADARLPVRPHCSCCRVKGGWTSRPQNAISCAAKGGYKGTIQLFIDYAFDMNPVDDCNPLSTACAAAGYDVVKFLIDKGTDVNAGDLARNSPLVAAVEGGCYNIVKLVLDSGIKINLSEEYFDHSPLEAAAGAGHARIVQLLLSRGALPDVGGAGDFKPIIIAAAGGHEDIVCQLIEAGADVDAYVDEGDFRWNIAIDAAVENGHTQVVRRLIEGGATRLNGEPDKEPLLFAIDNGHHEIARLLIKAGANVKKTKFCHSILKHAISQRWNDIVILMIEHGAQVDSWDLSTAKGELNKEAIEAIRIAHANSDGSDETHSYNPEGWCQDCGDVRDEPGW